MLPTFSRRKIVTALLLFVWIICTAIGICLLHPGAQLASAAETEENYVASVGDVKYTTLQTAIDSAQSGDTVTLLKDIKIDSAGAVVSPEGTSLAAYINGKSLTLDGGEHTISSDILQIMHVIGGTKESLVTVTIKNLTIKSIGGSACPLMTRGGNLKLILDNVTLDASESKYGSNAQVLTIARYNKQPVPADERPVVIIQNGSELKANRIGYALELMTAANVTVTDSTLSGWSAIYFKGGDTRDSTGSEVTVENSVLTSSLENVNNSFGMITFEDGGIELSISNSTINLSADNTSLALVYYSGQGSTPTGNTVVLTNNDVKINGGPSDAMLVGISPSLAEEVKSDLTINGGTINVRVPAEYLAEGMLLFPNAEGTYSVGDETAVTEAGMTAVIGNVAYKTLAEAVAAVPADGVQVTITLIGGENNVITGNGVKFNDGQNIEIDFNGKTYNVDKTVGSAGTETNGFQLLKGSVVTLKNGAMTSDTAKILLQNYCNLTLDGMTLDLSDKEQIDYVISNNCGETVITGDTQIIAPEGCVAFDVYYGLGPNYYDGVSVTFGEDFTGMVKGIVEYGARVATENWQDKSKLTIENGNFDITFKVNTGDATEANITANGGNFGIALPEEYLGAGNSLYTDGNGGYAVAPANTAPENMEKVAVLMDGKGYATIAEAIEAARGEDNISLTLYDDLVENVVIPAGKTVVLNLNGKTITAEKDNTIENKGNLTINGEGSIVADAMRTALCNRSGATLTVNGGTISSVSGTALNSAGTLIVDGGTFNGGLCAVYANTGTDIEISDGTFNSRVYALSGATIAITGGTFNHSVYSASCKNFISGGTFTKEFPAAEYVAENCSLTQYGVVTDIAPAAEIEKDGKVYAFATIADALALASRGDTITLVGNVTENVVIAKNKVVTLDLNGYTLTNATGERGDHTILNNGTLTIIDGSYAGTGRVITTGGQNCAAVYNAIGGEVTLDGGTYTSNRTTGDYYIIQNHGAMTINDGVTVLQPSVVSSGIASGWYTPAEESQTTYLTINGGTFASNRITVKNDEINVLVINGGTFDQTEGYGDASYAVQSVQNWAIGILGGGTFGANVQSWAYQSGAGIVRGSLDITGGVYFGTVSAHYYINNNESKEDDTPDVEISGGAFASQPAEKFLTAGFTTVSNSEGMFTVVGENSAEADALRTAQVNAQADVGQYLATLGLKDFDLASDDPYTGIQDDEVSLADETAAVNAALTALRTAYADIAAARSEYDVAGARLAAMDAADTLADALAAELSAYKAAATSSIEEAKEEGMADLETWLNAYLDELLGTAGEPAGVIRAAAYTAETTDGDIYAKLAQAFSEDNAKLVLKYYNDALAAIDSATTVSEVTTAVSAFKAQVASVEAAAGNTPSLTAVYILLAVVLVVAIAVFAAVLLRRAPAPQPAAPAEGTPAAPAQETAVTEAAPEEEVSVSEGTPEDEASEEAPAEESAAEERAVNTIVLPELDGDREHIVIAANVRSFDEAYEALGDEARSLFNKVKAYALSKPDTEEIPLSSGVCIKRGSKKVVKLAVRRGNPVALFLLESDGLKDLRRSASASVRLKVRETELVLREESDLEAAYTMVDLSIGQIERDIEEAKERRREARRLRRRQLRETAASEAAVSEETEDIPEEGAADETPADESDE